MVLIGPYCGRAAHIVEVTAHGLCHLLDRNVHHWVPMPVHSHSIWMAGILGLAAILQEERKRSRWRSSVWGSERNVCTGYVVPAVHPVSDTGLFRPIAN